MSNPMQKLQAAYQASQEGQANKAIQLCQQVLRQHPKLSPALELMGIIYHQCGEMEKAIGYLRKAVLLSPQKPELWQNLGNILHHSGQSEEAIQAFEKVIQLQPGFLPAYINLALIYKDKKELEQAFQYCQQALAINPNVPEIYNTLGILHDELCQIEASKDAFITAIRLNPQYAFAQNNLGSLLFKQGLFDEALMYFNQAVALSPTYVTAIHNIGLCLREKGHMNDAIPQYYHKMIREAMPYFEQALALQPDFAEAYTDLGLSYKQLRELDKAEQYLQQAVTKAPRSLTVHSTLARFYLDLGHVDKAQAVYLQAAEAMPEKKLWKLAADTLCPLFFMDTAEIDAYRQGTMAAVEAAFADSWNIELADLAVIDCRPSFYLSYQGLDDLPLKASYADLFIQNFAEQPLFIAEKRVPNPGPKKLHLGILVTKGHEGIFCKFLGGIVSRLSREHMDITLICAQEMVATISGQVNTAGIHFCTLHNNLEVDVQKTRALGCDVMFFFEVATDWENYFLPFFQLAPIQIASWAIPVTSGIPYIDYYVTSALVETEDSQNYFREKLVCFETLPIYYLRPEPPEVLKPRAEYGLSEEAHIYFCPQNFNKLHPDFDAILLGIAEKDPLARFVFIQREHELFTHLFLERLERQKPGISETIAYIPWQTQEGYLNAISVSDVVLDTLHYGGGTSVYDAFSTGTPIVTLPLAYHRSRVGMALYQKMGIPDCTATSIPHYVDIAVGLATNPAHRADVKARILANNHAIYEEDAAVAEFEAFCLQLAQNPAPVL